MNISASELGKKSPYESHYNPKLLFSIPRILKRSEIGIDDTQPGFYGLDLWTHYEISWLNQKGKPMVAIGQISYSASSKNIIESKSMKLYFNSFNNTKLSNVNELIQLVEQDISNAVGEKAKFTIIHLNDEFLMHIDHDHTSLDDLDVECNIYQPYPEFLFCHKNIVSKRLYSNLLKSNCLVTNQPDWGTIFIEYHGREIDQEGLLKYIISLRNHNEFHEQCIERVFKDIQTQCAPLCLTVYARYTRRGGIDINPYRTTNENFEFKNNRLIRQ